MYYPFGLACTESLAANSLFGAYDMSGPSLSRDEPDATLRHECVHYYWGEIQTVYLLDRAVKVETCRL